MLKWGHIAMAGIGAFVSLILLTGGRWEVISTHNAEGELISRDVKTGWEKNPPAELDRDSKMAAAEAYLEGMQYARGAFMAEQQIEFRNLVTEVEELKEELETVTETLAQAGIELTDLNDEVKEIKESQTRAEIRVLFMEVEKKLGNPVSPEVNPEATDPFGAAAPGTPEFPEAADPFGATAPEAPQAADPFARPSEPEAGSADPFGEPSKSTKAWTAKEAEELDNLFGPPPAEPPQKHWEAEPPPAEPPVELDKRA